MAEQEMIPPRTAADVARIVQERVQESTMLDFKRQLPEASKNFDLARAIAALSNTEGGCIIYGIDEDKDSRASNLAPFRLDGCTERIALVAGTLDEPITPRAIYTIEESPATGYAIIELDKSYRAPHFLEGIAFGRTPKTTVPLSRRQVGELFAQSRGFLEEFRIQTSRPGSLLVHGHRDEDRTWVSFKNDGDTEIQDVDWEDPDDSQLLAGIFTAWPFPVPVLYPNQQVVHPVQVTLGRGPFAIKAIWRGSQGREERRTFRVTF